ncbi:GNAT family N-acetyltransferase [Mesorhizobium sp. KR9-304]|uniref:GNAT family N-acetyltransferase n=1 Tax=Mesorhizobium sp. KR9-304 TaxID=3156614 RepID=UPI0032B32586
MTPETARYEIGGYRPGALAAIVGLHAGYYARHWNFGLPFETRVGAELAEFLARHDPSRDLFLVAYSDGDAVASVIIDQSGGSPKGAHLRWFIVSEQMQGKGLGADLLGRALNFCDERGYERVWLTTFAGLDAARGLYERHGFVLTGEAETDQWSGDVREQVFERRRPPAASD